MYAMWPERVIAAPTAHDVVSKVLGVFSDYYNMLTGPATLDSRGFVALIGAFPLGADGLNGSGSLLLRVTYEQAPRPGSLIRLAVVSSARPMDLYEGLLPDQVAQLVDGFAEKIRRLFL